MKKDFFKRWKQGIKDLSPEAQMKAKMVGIKGNIVGILIGGGFLIYRGFWPFIFMLFFVLFLQCIELIGTKQQYERMVMINHELEMQRANKLIGEGK